MAYRAVGLGKEFNKMQGWGEVLDLTDLNDANEEFDETLFNIDQDDQDVYKKEREENRNIDDIGTMGLKEVVDDGDEIAIPTY